MTAVFFGCRAAAVGAASGSGDRSGRHISRRPGAKMCFEAAATAGLASSSLTTGETMVRQPGAKMEAARFGGIVNDKRLVTVALVVNPSGFFMTSDVSGMSRVFACSASGSFTTSASSAFSEMFVASFVSAKVAAASNRLVLSTETASSRVFDCSGTDTVAAVDLTSESPSSAVFAVPIAVSLSAASVALLTDGGPSVSVCGSCTAFCASAAFAMLGACEGSSGGPTVFRKPGGNVKAVFRSGSITASDAVALPFSGRLDSASSAAGISAISLAVGFGETSALAVLDVGRGLGLGIFIRQDVFGRLFISLGGGGLGSLFSIAEAGFSPAGCFVALQMDEDAGRNMLSADRDGPDCLPLSGFAASEADRDINDRDAASAEASAKDVKGINFVGRFADMYLEVGDPQRGGGGLCVRGAETGGGGICPAVSL